MALLQCFEGTVIHSGYYTGVGERSVAVHQTETPCFGRARCETVAEAFGHNLCLGCLGHYGEYVGCKHFAFIDGDELYVTFGGVFGKVDLDCREAF